MVSAGNRTITVNCKCYKHCTDDANNPAKYQFSYNNIPHTPYSDIFKDVLIKSSM